VFSFDSRITILYYEDNEELIIQMKDLNNNKIEGTTDDVILIVVDCSKQTVM